MSSSYVAGVIRVIELALAQVVGSISPTPVPSSAVFPYVVVRQIVNTEVESLLGLSNLNQTMMQVECWHPSYEVAFALRQSIRNALMAGVGPISGSGLTIDAINTRGETDLYDGQRELHELIARYGIWWSV